MDRNREARRGTVAAVNGVGLTRRGHRNGSSRDSPEEDTGIAMGEMGRLRDRGSKKDRDRDCDRSGRSKRRRGERILHASNREEGDDSSSESVEDEEEDASVAVRLPVPPALNPGALSSMPHNHHRRSFPMTAKVSRSPAVLKAADEMIGVPVPRRARSSSAKRAQEFSGSGVEPVLRQASNSPASPSPLSAASISPPSSSASIRKKMKLISGTKHRQAKLSKSASVPEDLEIEVAEVLFGLTRQFQSSPPKPETQKLDAKGTYGSGNEAKSRVSSPISISPQPAVPLPSYLPPPIMSTYAAPMAAPAPKRKRPRPFVNLEDESPTSLARVPAPPGTSVSSGAKMLLVPPAKSEASSPRSENNEASPAVENGSSSQCDLGVSQVAMPPIDVQQDSVMLHNNLAPDLKLSTGESDGQDRTETSEANELLQNDLDANLDGTAETKANPAAESSREVKFSIDLMAPPGKSSPEREGLLDNAANHKAPIAVTEMVPKVETAKVEEEKVEKTAKLEEARIAVEAVKVENPMREDFYMKKQIVKERTLDLQLDFDKPYKDGLRCSKQQFHKQQSRSVKIEPKQERAAQPALPLQMPIAGWPGCFPPFGYMGQVPSLQPALPMDGSSRSSKPVQPTNFASSQLRPKRCATHCYIAHNVHYHQQLSRMNPFWPAGAAPLYGDKQYNLNVVPPLESSIVRNPLQGSFPVSNMGSMQDNGGLSAASSTGHSSKDKNSADNTFIEAAQRKQLVLKQTPLPGMATNMLHGAFIFPINQQQAAAKSGVSKPTPGAGNAALSSTSASSAVAGSGMGGPATTMSFNYPGLPPNEAMYMAILPNGAYPFPIPSHVGAATPYRGSPAQAMPFFNGSLYSSQMLSSQQLQQQQQPPHQQPSHSHAQQGHQNTSTSSGSSSSQKQSQQSQRAPGSGATGTVGSSHSLAASKQQRQQLPTQCETGREDNPSTADSRVSQAQKSIYGNNLAMAIHPQNLAMFSPAAAAALGSGGGSHNEMPQPPSQHQSMKVELTTSQAFAMSFAPFGGVAAAAAPLPGHDFSSMVQNHAFFQGLPEAARHGYYFSAAAAGYNPVTQHKKPPRQIPEDGKSTGVSMTSSVTGEVEKKIMATSKAPESVSQQSLNFSQSDSDLPIPAILGNSSSSRTLNLIQAPANVGRVPGRPANVASPTSGAATATNSQLIQQQQLQHQQHQFIQLQKHQQQLQLQHQLANRTKSSTPPTNATVYSDRLPAGSSMAKFPQALVGFPQTHIQGSSTTQPPQWKTCARAATPASAASTATSTTKNQLPRQQSSSMQQPLLTPSHQTQISFGLNSSKAAAPTGQQHLAGGSSNPTLSSAASIVVGSPQNSVSKSTGGSPRSSSSAKAGPSKATALPLQQQQQQQQQPAKNSPSSSTLKSSPLSNSSSPSILGHPHLPSASNESIKHQQQSQSQQQLQKQQPFPQAQFFFSNPYMNAQTSQSNGAAVAAYYHQRRQSEPPPQQQQDHQNSTPSSSGILSMCPSPGAPTTSDQAKAAAASNMKGVTAPGLLQHHAQFAAMAQSAFPYMHPMPSVKPAEQKPAAGNDNLNACWQPEKR